MTQTLEERVQDLEDVLSSLVQVLSEFTSKYTVKSSEVSKTLKTSKCLGLFLAIPTASESFFYIESCISKHVPATIEDMIIYISSTYSVVPNAVGLLIWSNGDAILFDITKFDQKTGMASFHYDKTIEISLTAVELSRAQQLHDA